MSDSNLGKKICNIINRNGGVDKIQYTPKGEPGYIGINCNQAGINGPQLTLEGNKRRPGFCQKNCNELGKDYIPITNVNEEKKEIECECQDGKKWFKINNRHTWEYKCYPNYSDSSAGIPYDPTKGEFCYNHNQIAVNPFSKPMLCNGVAYDYTKQICKDGKLIDKPPVKTVNWYQEKANIPRP